jgi:probable F420-dependent oxidoreductase
MKIGVVFPQTEFGDDVGLIRDYAQAAEAIGYNHILAYDHVLGAVHQGREPRLTGPYTEATPFHEPFVLFAYWAGITSRIEFTSGVIILPQRQTALVAKQVAELDVLSGGRIRLGVGTGWNYVEYEALNEDFHNRGRREEEQIELLRRLWAEPIVDYTGKWHRIDRAGILPMPKRQVPIWMGGFNDVVWRRAARIADGFIYAGGPAMLDAWQRTKGYVADAGRDPAAFGCEAIVGYAAGPEKWREHAQSWADAGATHLSVQTMGAGLDARGHIAMLEPYFNAVRGL